MTNPVKHIETRKAPKILVVDDCHDEVAELVEHLRQQGYEPLEANDGAIALTIAIEELPDLILLDVRLPNLSGLQVCRTLSQTATTSNIPIIFLSHATDDSSKLEGFKAGCVDYVTKPFNLHETLARIKVHIDLANRSPVLHSDQYSNTVMRALSLLTGKDGHKLTVVEVAKEIGVSESTLRRRFAKEFNVPLMNYIRESRFDWAKHMLKTSALRISDIAYDIGYSTAGDFSTAFRKRFGITPREYRDEK